MEHVKLYEGFVFEADPVKGTGKKPEGSDRRLYTDENPDDTVSVKFRTKEDIVDTLNKPDFKSKSHQRQSQIINLIHQRLRVAVEQAKDPEVIKRLQRGLDYIEIKKEESKEKTKDMKHIKEYAKFLNEGKEYQVYHNSYTSAVNTALEYAEKQGYTYDKEETFNKIGLGDRKPQEGVTNKITITLYKDGKEQKKALQIQVYGMGHRYELNAYIA